MHIDKIVAVEQYLGVHFPQFTRIERKHDFDLEAQSFKVTVGDHSLLLKVSDVFADDRTANEISEQLEFQNVAEKLRDNAPFCVLLTSAGTKLVSHD